MRFPQPRVVVFDINGEYADALRPHVQADAFKVSVLGGTDASRLRIPYYAFGRHGLGRILVPSEKTQRPAMNFALDALRFVEWDSGARGAGLVGAGSATLFDDCRPQGAREALDALDALRSGTSDPAEVWPHMNALACLVAESHTVRQGRGGSPERDAFHYSNVSPLITRIRRCVDDALFTQVISVDGGPALGGALDWKREGLAVVANVFGDESTRWKVHVLDLRNVAHDLMPLVLGGLLELLAFALFDRGPGRTFPTLLVLEEAHHYLRPIGDGDEVSANSLAYERLAKEGRKFGVGLWLSTQRPSELSATVLTQCGTWIAFRTIGASDLRALRTASEWIDDQELQRVSGLPRRHALVFGTSVRIPARVVAAEANPIPRSSDPEFSRWAVPPTPPAALAAAGASTPSARPSGAAGAPRSSAPHRSPPPAK
jgi:hypothetical protein